MATVTITIEDIPEGKVKVVATPNFEEMIKRDISGNGLTAAHGYALSMLNHVMKKSKEQSPENRIQVPRIKFAH